MEIILKRKKFLLALFLAMLMLNSTIVSAIAPTKIQPIPQSMFSIIEIPKETSPPVILEPKETFNRIKPVIKQLDPVAKVIVESTVEAKTDTSGGFTYDPEVSWYGPGFYGNRTACGLAYTKTILGVAHRSLPCGTSVTFRYHGKSVTVPVIDRGPYVDDRQWDLSGALCVALDHCFTGPIEYRIN